MFSYKMNLDVALLIKIFDIFNVSYKDGAKVASTLFFKHNKLIGLEK
jgi:hypothetical protein